MRSPKCQRSQANVNARQNYEVAFLQQRTTISQEKLPRADSDNGLLSFCFLCYTNCEICQGISNIRF